ncbi:ATP-sulfurylase [Carnobacterium iners]|nr:ATP-sulfurylase [Carnobacterium iners]
MFYCTHCDNPTTNQTRPHNESYRINISGTVLYDLLRHGIMPPREIVRPESVRIAIQGVQSNGLNEIYEAMVPVEKTLSKVFPYYIERIGIVGVKRYKKIVIEDVTNSDLLLTNINTRDRASSVYQGVFD